MVKEAAPWQQTMKKGVVRTKSDSSNRSKVDKGREQTKMESGNHRSKHAHSVTNGSDNLSDSGRKEGSNYSNNNNNRSSRESNNIKESLTKKNSTDNSSSSAAAPSFHGYESPLYTSPQSEPVKPLRERQMQPLPHFGDILPPPVEFLESSGKESLYFLEDKIVTGNSLSPK